MHNDECAITKLSIQTYTIHPSIFNQNWEQINAAARLQFRYRWFMFAFAHWFRSFQWAPNLVCNKLNSPDNYQPIGFGCSVPNLDERCKSIGCDWQSTHFIGAKSMPFVISKRIGFICEMKQTFNVQQNQLWL